MSIHEGFSTPSRKLRELLKSIASTMEASSIQSTSTMSFYPPRNHPDPYKGYISPIRGRRKSESMSREQRKPPITPHENDILMGRGGKNNQHSGNNQLRALARQQCQKYRVSSKKGKSSISRDLVKQVRAMDPPARFLKKSNETGLWEDVGDEVAREKASQALRDAVALEMSEEQADEEEEEEEEEQVDPIPASQAFRRTVSAPPVMDKSPNDDERRKTWLVQERQQRKQRHETPMFPPVTPASRTASAPAKRRRYYEEQQSITSPWVYHAPPEQQQYGSPEFVASRSNPEFHRPDFAPSYSYPTQQRQQHYAYPQQSYPQQSYRHHPGATYSMAPPHDEEDFDLFNGQLLEPSAGRAKRGGDRDESLERRSDTF